MTFPAVQLGSPLWASTVLRQGSSESVSSFARTGAIACEPAQQRRAQQERPRGGGGGAGRVGTGAFLERLTAVSIGVHGRVGVGRGGDCGIGMAVAIDVERHGEPLGLRIVHVAWIDDFVSLPRD